MIGENIRKIRENSGLSQQELADKLNVTRAAISSWETNRTEPNMGAIEKMATIFGTSKLAIIDGTETEKLKRVNSRLDYVIENLPDPKDYLSEEEKLYIEIFRAIPSSAKRMELYARLFAEFKEEIDKYRKE